MTLVEFVEALARVAEKVSPSSPAYKEKGLKIHQRRILPLFVKFEGIRYLLIIGLLFIFYYLLGIKENK